MKEQFNVLKGRTVLAALGATALAGGLSFAAVSANAAPIYSDTSVTADHQQIHAITSIDAPASWGSKPTSTVCDTTPTNLGSSFTVVPVPSVMCVDFVAHGTHLGPLTWSIVPGSEVNIPAGVTVGINPTSGKFTVTPPGGAVIPNNNQDISLTVKVTDGVATAFEMLNAKPIIVSGLALCGEDTNSCINAIDATATTDTVTLAGFNNNTTGNVDFTSTPGGATFALSNNPPGTALNGNHLFGTTAIPSTEDYPNVSVTATDAAGATAVDTFKLDVFGSILGNDTPRLSHGHAVMLNAVRENVYFVQSGSPSCDHFTIVGPGAINGHEGWVPAHLGLNVAVYGGLEAHHGYTVYYQPVSGPADCSTHSTDLWPGAHWGYVYFVS